MGEPWNKYDNIMMIKNTGESATRKNNAAKRDISPINFYSFPTIH